MADLSRNVADLPIVVIGATTAGVATTPVGSDTNGNLLVKDYSDGSASGGTAATVSSLAGGQYNSTLPTLTNTQQAAIQVDSSGRPIFSPLTYNTGSGTVSALNGAVVATAGGSVIFDISGTWVGTFTIQATNGDGSWINVAALSNQSGLITNTVTINGTVEMNAAGWVQARLIATAWTSGTATVNWSSTPTSHLLLVYSSNGVNFNTYATLTDSSQNPLGTTPASTAATASQEALVVGLSPNSPLPAGTNAIGTVSSKTEDGSGNAITSVNSQLSVRDVLDISSQYRAQSVTTTAAEALGAATILSNRKLLHVTPTNGTIYWGYSSAVTTTTGTPLLPNSTLWLSVTNNVHVYVIAAATTDCRVGEVS
jgi:hypothetical protein